MQSCGRRPCAGTSSAPSVHVWEMFKHDPCSTRSGRPTLRAPRLCARAREPCMAASSAPSSALATDAELWGGGKPTGRSAWDLDARPRPEQRRQRHRMLRLCSNNGPGPAEFNLHVHGPNAHKNMLQRRTTESERERDAEGEGEGGKGRGRELLLEPRFGPHPAAPRQMLAMCGFGRIVHELGQPRPHTAMVWPLSVKL